MNNILKYVFILIPFLCVLSTVFIVDYSLAEPIVSGKHFWFYMSMGKVLISATVVRSVYKNPFSCSLFDMLLGICCLSVLVVTSYRTGTILTTKCVSLLLLLCLYFFFRICVNRYKQLLPILSFFIIITGLVEAIWGILQLYGSVVSQHSLFKITGSFFNPGPYAGYLAVVLPLALYGSLHMKRYIRESQIITSLLTWVCRISFIAILLILPATMSRAAWLASLVGCLMVGYSKSDRIRNYCRKHKKQVILLACTLIVCTMIALSGIYFLKKDSADGRLLIWKISLKAIINNPGGAGIGHFSRAYGTEQASYFASGKASKEEESVAGSPEYAFNEYLQLAIEWGLRI